MVHWRFFLGRVVKTSFWASRGFFRGEIFYWKKYLINFGHYAKDFGQGFQNCFRCVQRSFSSGFQNLFLIFHHLITLRGELFYFWQVIFRTVAMTAFYVPKGKFRGETLLLEETVTFSWISNFSKKFQLLAAKFRRVVKTEFYVPGETFSRNNYLAERNFFIVFNFSSKKRTFSEFFWAGLSKLQSPCPEKIFLEVKKFLETDN